MEPEQGPFIDDCPLQRTQLFRFHVSFPKCEALLFRRPCKTRHAADFEVSEPTRPETPILSCLSHEVNAQLHDACPGTSHLKRIAITQSCNNYETPTNSACVLLLDTNQATVQLQFNLLSTCMTCDPSRSAVDVKPLAAIKESGSAFNRPWQDGCRTPLW